MFNSEVKEPSFFSGFFRKKIHQFLKIILKKCVFRKPNIPVDWKIATFTNLRKIFCRKSVNFSLSFRKRLDNQILFQIFAFSKSSTRHAECKFDTKAGRLSSKVLKSFDQKREHSSITFPEKIPRNSFVLIENNFDEQDEGFSTKVLNQFTQILKKLLKRKSKFSKPSSKLAEGNSDKPDGLF